MSVESATPARLDRRAFLARTGLLGAIVATPGLLPGPIAGAARAPGSDSLKRVLGELSRDTFNGLSVLIVPGSDAYSRAQGTPRPEAGALEAKAPDFLIHNFDRFLPFPDSLARSLMSAVLTALDDLPDIPIARDLLERLPLGLARDVDGVLRELIENDETVPLAAVVALLLNVGATIINPLAVRGPFLAPFSRLSFKEKLRTIELLETPAPRLISAFDKNLPEPLKGSASGLLRFLGGALYEFAAFGAVGEFGVYDPDTKTVRKRPVGWRLSGYLPGRTVPVDGWDEFKGYYQGRRQANA